MNAPAFVLTTASPARAVLTTRTTFISGRTVLPARLRLHPRRAHICIAQAGAGLAGDPPAAEEAVEAAIPVEASADPVEPAAPVEAADPVEAVTPVEASAEPVEPAVPMEVAADPIEGAAAVEAAADPVNSVAPVEAVADPVEAAAPVDVAADPVDGAADPVGDAASIEAAAPVKADAEPVEAAIHVEAVADPVEAVAEPVNDSSASQDPVAEVAAGLAPAADAETPAMEKRKRRRKPKREVTLPLEQITIGMELDGVVKSVTDYGAFVGGMGTPTDGLLHVSQLTAGFVKNVTDVVNVGDKIKVRVLSIDIEKGNFSLTMKTAEEIAAGGRSRAEGSSGKGREHRREEQNRKWSEFSFDPEVFVDARVTSVTDFGAFCQFVNENGELLASAPTEGLIHISELSEERVNKVSDMLKVGDAVKVRVTSTDRKRNRISMSMKKYAEHQAHEEGGDYTKHMAEAESKQPQFKTIFELAFERAQPPSEQ